MYYLDDQPYPLATSREKHGLTTPLSMKAKRCRRVHDASILLTHHHLSSYITSSYYVITIYSMSAHVLVIFTSEED